MLVTAHDREDFFLREDFWRYRAMPLMYEEHDTLEARVSAARLETSC
jgi:hypothetical protein